MDKSQEDLLSSKLLISLLKECFSKSKILLPKSLQVLDVGAGKWEYVLPLHQFLCTYKSKRAVQLKGIDLLGKHWEEEINLRTKGLNIEYQSINVFDLKKEKSYDVIFLIHMFPPYRFKEHKIPFRPYEEMISKIFSLLKVEGIVVAIAYGSPEEEYSFFKEFPKDSILFKGRYSSKGATETDYLLGKDTFHDNMVLIAKK